MRTAQRKPSGNPDRPASRVGPVRAARAEAVWISLVEGGERDLQLLREDLPDFTRCELDLAIDDLVADGLAFVTARWDGLDVGGYGHVDENGRAIVEHDTAEAEAA